MSNFIAATQEWVRNRIQETKDYIRDVIKPDLDNQIRVLDEREKQDVSKIADALSNFSDEVKTGSIKVAGDARIEGIIDATGQIIAGGAQLNGPVVIDNPGGVIIRTPNGPIGFSPLGFAMLNNKGKVTKFFMQSDALVCDYPYDEIHTFYDKETGASLRYMIRQSTTFRNIVDQVEEYMTDGERVEQFEGWFNNPDAIMRHPTVRLFKSDAAKLFPATGADKMIPETLWFRVPDMFRIVALKLITKEGRLVKCLRDFHDLNLKELTVNAPYIKSVRENDVPAGATPRESEVDSNTTVNSYTSAIVETKHVADFDHGYYEVTDPDVTFVETYATGAGIVPNVVLKVNEFPKDEISVIYFEVVRV